MSENNHFEGEISAVDADDFELLRRAVSSGVQAHGSSLEWEPQTTEMGMFETKQVVGFMFSLAVSLASNIVASAIYDEIKAERPAATMTTKASGGCTIAVGKSSVYLAPSNPQSADQAQQPKPEADH